MKRVLAALLGALLFSVLLTGCAKVAVIPEENMVFVGTIEEITDSGLLVTATAGEVGFTKAIVSLTPEADVPAFTPLPGQTVLFTVLPQITEGDPVGVSAVSLEFVSGPMEYTATSVRTTCTEEKAAWSFVKAQAKNAGDIQPSADYYLYLPLLLFDSREELTAFIEKGGAYIRMDEGFDGDESISAASGKYDGEFFKEHQLMVLYLYAGKAPFTYALSNILTDGDTLTVTAARTIPETFMEYSDNIYCVFFVELDRGATASCRAFTTGFSEEIVEGW